MSNLSAPASASLHRSLDVPLTYGERFRIVVQLGSAMLASALLAVGWLQQRYGPPELRNIAELIVALAACVVLAPILMIAVRGVLRQDAGTMTEQLVALASLAALATGDFVTATLVPIIMNVGHFLEERSILGAQAAIEGLRNLHARRATIVTADGEREVDLALLKPGDILLVRPGDVIATDGQVIDGESAVDQSPVTGESTPEDVQPDSPVYAGSINLVGLLRVRVTRTGNQTVLGRVVELLRGAEQSKTPVLKLIEQYACYYVPVILTVAAVVLFVSRDVSRAVAVLVVGCPGAFVLAGPTAMIAALAVGSRLGILIKNTRFLESLADVDTVVLDKTGTVTLGQLQLASAVSLNGQDEPQVLELAARCAIGSRHPASRAIASAAHARELHVETAAAEGRTTELSGKGVSWECGAITLLLGRREWITANGVELPADPEYAGSITWLAQIERQGGATTRLAAGYFLLADMPRPEAKSALADLRSLGITKCILLTGDRRQVAEKVGQLLEVDRVIAEVLPEQKLDVVNECRAAGNTVMVVGDGINDALALASGDVGVAIGAAASDIALRSADVALMNTDLTRLPLAVRLARRTRLTIHWNVVAGLGIALFFVGLASAGVVSPVFGAILHNVGELFVIGNSARLLGFGPR
ncbi:MAG: cation-translocating P-type ATPase [Thermoguttaceae bacterium]